MSNPADLFSPRAWIGLGALVLVSLLLWLLAPVLIPFLVAAALAYVLHPLVQRLDRRGLPHSVNVVAVEALALLFLLGLLLLLVPILFKELSLLRQQLPALLDRLDGFLQPLLAQQGVSLSLDWTELKAKWITWLNDNREDWLAPVMASLKVGGNAVLSVLGYAVLVPVTLFFMLHDWEKLVRTVMDMVPPRWRTTVDRLARECDRVMGEYLRGQLLVMLVLALGYTCGLALFGLDLALPIGVFTGFAVFVPYLGFGAGLVLALLAGLLQFASPTQALVMVAVVYGGGQLLESFVLTPRLVGERIGLHPLAVIFALMAFGQLLGFVGVLIALPASAVLLVALRQVRQHYLASDLYTHDPKNQGPGA